MRKILFYFLSVCFLLEPNVNFYSFLYMYEIYVFGEGNKRGGGREEMQTVHFFIAIGALPDSAVHDNTCGALQTGIERDDRSLR
jgi:hypothetical protein